MPVGDAEDKARYAEYERLTKSAAAYREKAITAPTEQERRRAAEYAALLSQRAFHLFA